MKNIQVLIVNDSIEQRKLLVHAVENSGLGEVKHVASSGSIALERLKQSEVQAVLLKVPLNDINAVRMAENIKKVRPGIFIILTGVNLTTINHTLQQLDKDCFDFILLPDNELPCLKKIQSRLHGLFAQIITMLYTQQICTAQPVIQPPQAEKPTMLRHEVSVQSLARAEVVVIAASTGGPNALEYIFNRLPSTLNKPILVVQHMLPDFIRKLAVTLNKKSNLPVVEGKDGLQVKKGQVILAPGGVHMTVGKSNANEEIINLEHSPPVHGIKPAADVLFSSVARTYKNKSVLAVVLTGMGVDGLAGVMELKEHCNCYCLTESEESCVVYGMPKSVVDMGLSDDSANLQQIPNRISKILTGRG